MCIRDRFHDDQHGTAIVVTAALLGALRVVKKEIGAIRVVVNAVSYTHLDVYKRQDLISQDRTGYCVHDEPDIGLHAFDFYVSFIGRQFMGRIVVIGIHERPSEDSSSFGIVVYHGV